MSSLSPIFSLSLCFLVLACQPRDRQSSLSVADREADKQVKVTDDSMNDDRKRIVCFGNSLTAGYGLEEDQSFPALLQQRMDSLGFPYHVINAGLSGETSSGGLHRIDWILRQPLDIFILELGANDALRGLDLTATQSNLQGIVEKVRTSHPQAFIMIAGMKAPPNMGQTYTTEFEQIFSDLATENGLALLPFLLDGVAADPSLNLPDGIHPNVAGQKIVMENVWSVLQSHLDR
ncbi:MAG: arylesterase [Saprospiraceae bacterium]|nr:arylesterase [Saprospiraceae bacterium]